MKDEYRARQQLFEQLVTAGFEPLKGLIEHKRLEDELSDEDISKVMDNIAHNCKAWMRWLRHKNQHMYDRGRGGGL